ncbi:MAG: peptide ABC transporter substrate-binding protein [Chloroflexi bacterium]|nr:peptide ABC transporter substrate-binding protein [Chloroflexota bacterium]
MFALLLFGLFLLAACQQDNAATVVTRLVTESEELVVTQVVNQETVVTRVIVEERLVTPTPTPLPSGGELVTASLADVQTLNPVLSNDGASSAVTNLLFLSLLTLDPFTGAITPQVAEEWSVSPDGLTYTFTVRDDITWSDGTPLTAEDIAFTFAAVTTPELNSPHLSNFVNIADWQVIDEKTLAVDLNSPDCTTIAAFTVGILPSQVYGNDPLNLSTSPETMAPTVSSGPFMFAAHTPGQSVHLVSNPAYYSGQPLISSWVMQIYPSAIPMLNDLLAGQIDYTTVDAEFVTRVESAMARGASVNINKWFVNGFTYLAFNLANPTNPQNGWSDENGNEAYDEGEPMQVQEPHPILGDLAVRQAIATVLNYDEIITQAVYGQGGRVVADISPAINWAYNDALTPYETNVEQAITLLEDAGWVLVEPEEEDLPAIRVKDELPLALTLTLNAGNPGRERVAQLVKQQLEQIGFVVTVEILPFEEAVLKLRSQTFDMAITGWLDVNPEPDDSGFLSYTQDHVNVGFNFASYYNATVEENLTRGRTVIGCAAADRATFYQANQETLYQDIPYIPLYAPLINVVWNQTLQNFQPNGWNLHYNIHEWYQTE